MDLLSTTGMVYGEGLQEQIDPKEEEELKQFIGKHTGNYDSVPCHSFLKVYVDDLICSGMV